MDKAGEFSRHLGNTSMFGFQDTISIDLKQEELDAICRMAERDRRTRASRPPGCFRERSRRAISHRGERSGSGGAEARRRRSR